MDPYPPPRRVRIDTGMTIGVQHDGVIWVDEVVHPVFLVGLAPPGPGQSAGPKSIPLSISDAGRLNADVVEASAANINSYTIFNAWLTANSSPLCHTAAGIVLNTVSKPWLPIVPVVITADGAGNPPTTEIVAFTAAKSKDIVLFWKSDIASGAGQHIMRFRSDTAAPAAVNPAWAAVVVPVAALEVFPGDTYGVRIMGTVAKNVGVADGVNADWPNGAKVTFWGFYRDI